MPKPASFLVTMTFPPAPSPMDLRCSKLAAVPGPIAITTGLIVLFGWITGLEAPKNLIPGAATMKPNTAVCFVLLGLALAIKRKEAMSRTAGWRQVANACAGVTVLLCIGTVLEYALDADLYLETLGLVDAQRAWSNGDALRMATGTALTFVVLASAMLAMDFETATGRRPTEYLAAAATFSGAIALTGYAYNITALYQVAWYESMALHTAGLLVLLALGVLLSRSHRGWMANLTNALDGGLMARRLLPFAILVPFSVGWASLEGWKHQAFPAEFGIAIFAVCSIVVLTCLVLWTARSLNRVDDDRRAAWDSASAALQRNEEQFRMAVEASPTAMLSVNTTGNITLVNTKAEEIFGCGRTELLGQPIEMLIPESVRALHRELRDAFFARPSARAMGAGRDLYGLRKNGKQFPIEIGLNPYRNAGEWSVLASVIDITERRKVEATIAASLRDKEVMLQEIHHRVGNNLQVISSILNMQSQQSDDPGVVTALAECTRRIRSIGIVHEKLFRARNLATIDFGEHLREIGAMLMDSLGGNDGTVQLIVESQAVVLGLATAVPIGLVFNELVTNALKHAFPDNRTGTVRAHLSLRDQDTIVFTVQDDGVGWSETFQWQNADSLGLRMVRALVGQVNGKLEITSTAGLHIRITFPKSLA